MSCVQQFNLLDVLNGFDFGRGSGTFCLKGHMICRLAWINFLHTPLVRLALFLGYFVLAWQNFRIDKRAQTRYTLRKSRTVIGIK